MDISLSGHSNTRQVHAALACRPRTCTRRVRLSVALAASPFSFRMVALRLTTTAVLVPCAMMVTELVGAFSVAPSVWSAQGKRIRSDIREFPNPSRTAGGKGERVGWYSCFCDEPVCQQSSSPLIWRGVETTQCATYNCCFNSTGAAHVCPNRCGRVNLSVGETCGNARAGKQVCRVGSSRSSSSSSNKQRQ